MSGSSPKGSSSPLSDPNRTVTAEMAAALHAVFWPGTHHDEGDLDCACCVEDVLAALAVEPESSTVPEDLRIAEPVGSSTPVSPTDGLDEFDWHSISLALSRLPTWFPETLEKVEAIRARLVSEQGSMIPEGEVTRESE